MRGRGLMMGCGKFALDNVEPLGVGRGMGHLAFGIWHLGIWHLEFGILAFWNFGFGYFGSFWDCW